MMRRDVTSYTDAELEAEIRRYSAGGTGCVRRTNRGLPLCPGHLNRPAAKEWRRVARLLSEMGVLTTIDRAALAAYCQAYGRWVEAEEKLRETPMLFKTPSGYVQQSPWLGIANKQLELMGRYMVELGMTPASRSRVTVSGGGSIPNTIDVQFVTSYEGKPDDR
jgi:P27 family predicted phage terminase small subunit